MTQLNTFIEHSILRPDTTLADVRKVCEEAVQHQMAGVCIPPLYVREARRVIGDMSKIKLATVIGFPMGYSAIAAKIEEIKRAIEEDADELDVVINIAAVKSGNWNHVEHDIEGMAMATNMRGRSMKVIVECGMLTPEEIKKVAEIAIKSKAKFLKTGTGMHGHSATPAMVKYLKALAEPAGLKVKASGGVRTAAEALALVEAGADRVGTSAAIDILTKK